MSTTGGYVKATSAISRPTALLMTILGIIVVGGLLFGVFLGARWSFGKLAGNDIPKPAKVTTTTNSGNTTPGETNPGAVTETSSTSTTTPSATSAPQPSATSSAAVPATSNNLPYTGPASNTAIFFGTLIISYLAYRKKLLKSS